MTQLMWNGCIKKTINLDNVVEVGRRDYSVTLEESILPLLLFLYRGTIARVEVIIGNVNHLSRSKSSPYSCEINFLSRGVICRREFEEIQ